MMILCEYLFSVFHFSSIFFPVTGQAERNIEEAIGNDAKNTVLCHCSLGLSTVTCCLHIASYIMQCYMSADCYRIKVPNDTELTVLQVRVSECRHIYSHLSK